MYAQPEYLKSDVPTGKSGEWVVEKVDIPDREPHPLDDARSECFRFRPGRYTCLRHGQALYMTDLYDEWWTQKIAADQAVRRGGHVLITGLGLGLIIESILRTPGCSVQQITVVELSEDVIRLVGPHLQSRYPGRVGIVNGDAFTWIPPTDERYSVVWHDIWPDPHERRCDEEMNRLEERFRQCSDWQGAWPREYHIAETPAVDGHMECTRSRRKSLLAKDGGPATLTLVKLTKANGP